MKLFFSLFLFIFLGNQVLKSQDLIVKGIAPNLFLTHKVVAKESWYSIGRLYNVNPKELATYNSLSIEKGLVIAQMIKIPLTANNTKQEKSVQGTNEFLVPYYHVVEKSEGLYRIAINAGTSMDNIKAYNQLNSDALNTGTNLVVGYLKVKRGESNLIAKEVPPAVDKNTATKENVKETIPVPDPVVEKEVPAKVKEAPVVVKETPKAPMQEVKEVTANPGNTEGVFKKEFNHRYKKESTGLCAVFKTNAGWSDQKFYALMDGVAAGTIVQLTNSKNGKTVYAKILGEMQELKQNNGLIIRISNATANALGTTEESFALQVKY